MTFDQDSKIAVIGGGLCGLVMATELQKKGYAHVTLFESEAQLGGKLYTIWFNGQSYEMGAHFGLPDQKHLRALLKSYNIKIDGPKLARVNYDPSGNKVMQIPRENLNAFVKELDRLPTVLAEYKSLDSQGFYPEDEALMLPFSKWCEKHNFKLLRLIYGHYYTSYGLGDIEHVPALYVLKVMSYDNLMSFMELPELCTFKEGVHTLVNCMAQEIRDIRLTQKIINVEKGCEHQVVVHTEFESIAFDRVIITAPLNPFASLFDDEILKKQINQIQYYHYNVYAFKVDAVQKRCGCIIENLNLDRKGHVMIWNSRWESKKGEELLMVYTYENPNLSSAEALKVIEDDLRLLGIKNPRLYQYKKWLQSPYVETQILQEGFYDKIHASQGKEGVYFAGEILSGVSMENTIKYAKALIGQYF